MARTNAQQWLDKWGRRLSAAGPDITSGVQATRTAPGVAAAAAADRMLAGVTEAVTSGTWQNNVAKVPLQDWQTAMVQKGIPRLQQGIAQAQAKKVANVQQTLAAVDAAVAAANQTPRGNLEQNLQRAATFAREMAARAPKRQK
jgi:hypothetical protein